MFNPITLNKTQDNAATRKVFVPSIQIYDAKDEIVLTVDMPGVDEKSVELLLENDLLTVFGRTVEDQPQGYQLAYAEYQPGDYRRSFALASDRINRDGIQAVVKNGVLKITLPKAEAVKPKKIEIKAA